MPRVRRPSPDPALVLLLGLCLPLPLQAAPATDPVTQVPGELAPPPTPTATPAGPPGSTALPRVAAREPRLEALEAELQALKRQQEFQPLQLPGSIVEILALLALPLSGLALALSLLQARGHRRAHQAIWQRLKELRQDLQSRAGLQPNPTPLTPVGVPELRPTSAEHQASSPAVRPLPGADEPTTPPDPLETAVSESTAAPQPPQPLSINDWITALNSGQRDSLRSQAATQLNITSESEDAIQMGRSDATCLEEVAAGGSYLGISCGENHWLLPTERTLGTFRSFQPTKGLFTYQTMLSGHPQVDQACRIEPYGSGWRVVSPGVIRVPG